jgi:hypothetical protein
MPPGNHKIRALIKKKKENILSGAEVIVESF